MSGDICALIEGAHSPDSTERLPLMLNIRAYCDESYNHRIYTVSGYMATGEEWTRLQTAWANALEDEQVPFAKNSSFRVFHSADFEGGYGVFSTLTREARDKIQRRFAEIINETKLYGFASAIVMEHYNEVVNRIKAARKSFWSPYFLAFQHGIEMAALAIEHLPHHEAIDFIFDRNEQLGGKEGGRAHQLYNSMLRSTTLPFIYRLGNIVFADKARMLPLQAADYLAYENFRFLNEVKYGNKLERWQWQMIKGSVDGRLFDKAELEKFLELVEW